MSSLDLPLAAIVAFAAARFRCARPRACQVVADEANRRVDITIDGKPFTSYIWPTTLKKPVLYPLIDDDGVTVTRGYPLAPRPASASTIRTTPAFGSTTATSTASTSGTTPTPSSRKTAPRWARFFTPGSSPPRAALTRGELVAESVWVDWRMASRFSSKRRAISSRAAIMRESSTWSSLSRPSITSSSMTTRKACSACASPAGLSRPKKKAASSATPTATPPRSMRHPMPAPQSRHRRLSHQ